MLTDGPTIVFYVVILGGLGVVQLMIWVASRPARERFPATADGLRYQTCGYVLRDGVSVVCPECGTEPSPRVIEMPIPSRPRFCLWVALAVFLFPLTLTLGYPIAARFDAAWTTMGTLQGSDLQITKDGKGAGGKIKHVIVQINGKPRMLDLRTMSILHFGPVGREALIQAFSQPRAGTPVLSVAAATAKTDELLAHVEALRAGRCPETWGWVESELKGRYVIADPDDNFGPCLFIPDYAVFCVPMWIGATVLVGRRIMGAMDVRRFEEAELRQKASSIQNRRHAKP